MASQSVRRGALAVASRLAARRSSLSSSNAVRALSTVAQQQTGGQSGGSKSQGTYLPRIAAAGIAATAAVGLTFASSVHASEGKPDYEAIKKDIIEAMDEIHYEDGSYGPVLVRLAWHAAGTYDKATNSGGSNGATMRYNPEANHGANSGLSIGRSIMDKIKSKHPEISYADLWTLGGVVAIEDMGGPIVPWRPGRTDKPSGKFCPPDGRLPDAAQGADHLRAIFYRMGFNDQEIVALSGAHALGRCHQDRSGYDGPWTYSPTTFSNNYFHELLDETWTPREWDGPLQYENAAKDLMMLPTDLSLIEDPAFRKWVELYAEDSVKFFEDFAQAFSKLLELGVEFPAEPKPWWRFGF